MAEVKLIIGLGNPGRDYERTRHNLGFMVVQRLARELDAPFGKCRYAQALTAEARLEDHKVLFVLPMTFMNKSGLAVGEIVKFDKVLLENILVVCDDIALDLGEMRLKPEGSDGGHNGLKSLIAHLNSTAFFRMRLGVGAPRSREQQVDHVLSEFTKEEQARLEPVIEEAVGHGGFARQTLCDWKLSGAVGEKFFERWEK